MNFIPSILLLAVLSVGFSIDPAAAQPLKWVVTKECSLRVDGSTNINRFSCQIPRYTGSDTLSANRTAVPDGPHKMTGQVSLDIMAFDCHNGMMTADLRKTLKAKEYPVLTIRFRSLSALPGADGPPVLITGAVDITLSGVTKSFKVDYRLGYGQDKTITLTGTRNVNFSDFNLVPPRKLGGMIKTADQLAIVFSLKMQVMTD